MAGWILGKSCLTLHLTYQIYNLAEEAEQQKAILRLMIPRKCKLSPELKDFLNEYKYVKVIGRSYAMKKHLLLILILSFILTNVACGTSSGDGESEVGGDETVTFQATILEIQEGYYLVEPMEGSAELNSADQIAIPMTNMNPSPEPEVGDVLEIEYDGSIAESYPAQIANVYGIRVVES